MKYAVMVMLDLDVEMPDKLDHPKASEIESTTESRVRTSLEKAGNGIKIEVLRTKLLCKVEKE